MDAKLKYLLLDLEENPSEIPDPLLKSTEAQLGFTFPSDYIEVIRAYNGGEGEIGENGWLRLYPFEELEETNKDYDFLLSEIPDYFLFGKDAADTAFAFHKTNKTFHAFGFLSDFKTDPIEFCGNSFVEFLEYLNNR